jgi:hypothetical protein
MRERRALPCPRYLETLEVCRFPGSADTPNRGETLLSLNDEISAAIAAHGMWKTRSKTAIASGRSEFSPADIGVDNKCQFGKWIHGIADARVTASGEYRQCLTLHQEFHMLAARVLSMALAGKKAEAEGAMAAGGDFATVSGKLTRAMMDWNQTVAS